MNKSSKSIKTNSTCPEPDQIVDWNTAVLNFSKVCCELGKDPALILSQATECLFEEIDSRKYYTRAREQLGYASGDIPREDARFFWISPDEVS